MNFVIIKQNIGKYLFYVPEPFHVAAGANVIVETNKGQTTGIAVCDSFYVCDEETLKMLFEAWGTQKERMKPVIGFVEFKYFDRSGEE